MPTDPGAATPRPDPGLACLTLLARFHGISVEPAQLAHEFAEGRPFGETEILLAAKKLGLKAKRITTAANRLDTTPLPALARDKQGGFFILARCDDGQALIHDPASPRPESLTLEALEQRWSGEQPAAPPGRGFCSSPLAHRERGRGRGRGDECGHHRPSIPSSVGLPASFPLT